MSDYLISLEILLEMPSLLKWLSSYLWSCDSLNYGVLIRHFSFIGPYGMWSKQPNDLDNLNQGFNKVLSWGCASFEPLFLSFCTSQVFNIQVL